MTPPTKLPPVAADRITLPLLRIVVLLGVALSAWPALVPDGPRYAWVIALPVGLLVALFYWHPSRVLGFVPYTLTAGLINVLAAVAWGWCDITAAIGGAVSGLLLGVFLDRHTTAPFADWSHSRIGSITWPLALVALAPAFLAGVGLARGYTIAAAVAFGVGALLAWVRLFRPAVELFAEPLLWVMHHVRGTGPGLEQVPPSGPCLVIANHACWLDPLFLAKVLPRPVTPMMTSKFYDLPGLRFLVRHVFRTIRVPEVPLKQDVPEEILQAIAALDRGECVVIFPEGYLRRTEERLLRRFGRGVWQILQARPSTPVFACWIEGGWGSYTSYRNGKPTKNKKPDFRRPITVGVAAVSVPASVLEEHLRTRLYLMNAVVTARQLLGLPEHPLFELPEKEGNADSEEIGTRMTRDRTADQEDQNQES